uniref:Uncharacterized protein n=1 Tax=Glossina palpalis gambiensis TaxID=67801 RepID=A0A1B0AZF9_9MUSC
MQNYTVCYPPCSTSNLAVNGMAGNMPPFQGQLSSANYQPAQIMNNFQNFPCAYSNGFPANGTSTLSTLPISDVYEAEYSNGCEEFLIVYTDLNEGFPNSWNNPLCILNSNNQCNVHLCPVSPVVPVSPASSIEQYKVNSLSINNFHPYAINQLVEQEQYSFNHF